jgi:hypothetical protein
VRTESVLSEQSTIVKIDLVVKDTMETNMLTNWFGNTEFSKLIKIKLVQSTNPFITNGFVNGDQSILNFNYNKIPNAGVEQYDISLLSDSNGGLTAEISDSTTNQTFEKSINRFFTDIDDKGRKFYDIQFSMEFTIPLTSISHLTYFAVSYIDPMDLAKEFNLDPSTLVSLNEELSGRLIIDPVILQGSVTNSSVVYTDAIDRVWLGEVHVDEQGRYRKGKTSLPELSDEDAANALIFLTRTTVPNIKIHDFRNIDILKSLEFDFSDLEEQLLIDNAESIKFTSHSLKQPKYDDVFSDIFFSRDNQNNNRFLFGLNLERLIKLTSAYSRLYENLPSFSQLEILKNIDFKHVVIKRRQVTKNGNSLDEYEPSEVVTTGFNHITAEGVLRVAPLSFDKIVHFQVVDKTMNSKSDGFYEYTIDLAFEDTIEEFLRQKYISLVEVVAELGAYYTEASSPQNYSAITDTYKVNFINENIDRYELDIVPLVSEYFEILQLLTGPVKDFDLVATTFNVLLHPKTGTIRGFLSILKLMQDLMNKLYYMLDGRVINEKVPHKDSTAIVQGSSLSGGRSSLKTVELTHKFTNYFDASPDISTGYEFLFEDKIDISTKSSMLSITYDSFRQRVEKETLKYFKSLTENLEIVDSTIQYNPGDTTESSIYSFLSPSKILFANRAPFKQLNTNFTDYIAYNEQMAEILDYNNQDIYSLNTSIKFPEKKSNKKKRRDRLENKLGLILKNSGFSIDRPSSGNKVISGESKQAINFTDEEKSGRDLLEDKISTVEINNVLLSLIGFQDLDLDEKSIEQFNLNNPETKETFQKLAFGSVLSAFLGIVQDPVRDLPNQIKALILSFIKPEIINNTYDEDTIVQGDKYFSMFMNYFNLMKVEYLDSYEEMDTGKLAIKSPQWKILTPDVFNNSKTENRKLLCRLMPYENDIFNIKSIDKLQLPIINQYFWLINPDVTAEAFENIVSSQPSPSFTPSATDTRDSFSTLNNFIDASMTINTTINSFSSEMLIRDNVSPITNTDIFEEPVINIVNVDELEVPDLEPISEQTLFQKPALNLNSTEEDSNVVTTTTTRSSPTTSFTSTNIGKIFNGN